MRRIQAALSAPDSTPSSGIGLYSPASRDEPPGSLVVGRNEVFPEGLPETWFSGATPVVLWRVTPGSLALHLTQPEHGSKTIVYRLGLPALDSRSMSPRPTRSARTRETWPRDFRSRLARRSVEMTTVPSFPDASIRPYRTATPPAVRSSRSASFAASELAQQGFTGTGSRHRGRWTRPCLEHGRRRRSERP